MENVYCCGTCGWWLEGEWPVEKGPKPKDFVARGYCYFNPPFVFPMPKQTQTLGAMGQPKQSLMPLNMRPSTSANEPMCHGYSPRPEVVDYIKANTGLEEPCSGTCGDENCSCDK